MTTTITIKLDDVVFEATGYYSEGEPAVHYPVDNAHPGSASDFELESLTLIKGSLLDFLYLELTPEALTELIISKLED